jgi:hypothetical protein
VACGGSHVGDERALTRQAREAAVRSLARPPGPARSRRWLARARPLTRSPFRCGRLQPDAARPAEALRAVRGCAARGAARAGGGPGRRAGLGRAGGPRRARRRARRPRQGAGAAVARMPACMLARACGGSGRAESVLKGRGPAVPGRAAHSPAAHTLPVSAEACIVHVWIRGRLSAPELPSLRACAPEEDRAAVEGRRPVCAGAGAGRARSIPACGRVEHGTGARCMPGAGPCAQAGVLARAPRLLRQATTGDGDAAHDRRRPGRAGGGAGGRAGAAAGLRPRGAGRLRRRHVHRAAAGRPAGPGQGGRAPGGEAGACPDSSD